MDYAKFENFQEFYDAVEMGLDIEFFIDGIRYNISWQNNKPFICVCPDVLRCVFVGTRLKAAEPRVAHKPCLSVIDQLVENRVLRVRQIECETGVRAAQPLGCPA